MQLNCFSKNFKLKIGIIGAGSYGSALGQCFCVGGNDVVLVAKSTKVAQMINERHVHDIALPSIKLSSKIRCATDNGVLSNVDVIFITVPAGNVLDVCKATSNLNRPFVLCSKGLDAETGALLSQVMDENISNEYAILSGPSFAAEIAVKMQAEVNIAGKNKELCAKIAGHLSTNQFKIKTIDDYIGLQIAGVFKNILAVGCGILKGLEVGCSCTAKLVTKGIQEITAITEKMGGSRNTILEVGGIGDIFLTCTSTKSRNINFGEFYAHNGVLSEWKGSLAEGALSAKWIPVFEKRCQLSLPFFHKLYEIIYENLPAKKIVD